jgi:hypothetical protein
MALAVYQTALPSDRKGIDRRDLLKELSSQRAHCEGRSPFYVAVLRALEEDAAAGAPWLDSLETAWSGRSFAVGWEAAHLLLACLHFAALSGAAEELGAVYPSCAGSGKDPGAAVRSYLRRAPGEFWERLRVSFVQTNEVDRSVAWMIAAAAAFGERNMPFHLVELGASAGLNLVGDHLPHACRFVSPDGARVEPPARWDRLPHPVLTRTGLDIRPRRLADPQDRLWLRACVWADDLARLERLDRAVEAYLRLEKESCGPRLVSCPFSQAPAWIAANRPPRPQEGLIVFNSIATIYLGNAEYEALRGGLTRALAPWQERAIWVEFERARGASAGPLELSVHRVVDSRLCTRVLASGEPRPQVVRLLEGWPFMRAG